MNNQTVEGKNKKTSPPKTIYLPCSCDLFHVGHLRAIRQCAKKGRVIVGLLDCPSYKKTVIPYEERKEILEALPEVEQVVKQVSLDFSENLKKFKPDFVASGDGFEEVELKAIKNSECETLNISYYDGQSTKKIKRKIAELNERMRKDSLEYFETLERFSCIGPKHKVSIDNAVKYCTLKDCDWAEFGVFEGASANYLLTKLPENTILHLFDSFEGLPEDWIRDYPKGRFKVEKIPSFPEDKVKLYVGWFKDTILEFVGTQKKPLGLINMDADIYSSTKEVLGGINELIIPNTVIMFDEYYSYPQWQDHEYKAFQEYVKEYSREFEYLGRSDAWQVWLKITK